MLLFDVSNVCYTGASSKYHYFGHSSDYKIRSLVYFLEKVACYYSVDKDMIAVFEGVGKMPRLSQDGGYKSGRQRNPMVEWEIICLKNILEMVNFPILYVESVEADHVIRNYCEQNRHKENIYLISADQDIASNVREGESFSTEILSYSSTSYNISKANFKEITGVHYNFMDINKLLCGCNSDRIKALPNGKQLYNAYIANLESLWRRKYSYDKTQHTTASFVDAIIDENNTLEAFLKWFTLSSYYNPEIENELKLRAQKIIGPTVRLPSIGRVDWQAYNGLIDTMNLSNSCSIKSSKSNGHSDELYRLILEVMGKGQTSTRTMFEGDFNTDTSDLEIAGIEDIRQLLEAEGGAL
jgi:hypothetical protein